MSFWKRFKSGNNKDYTLLDIQRLSDISQHIHKVERKYVNKYHNTIYFLNYNNLKYNFSEKYAKFFIFKSNEQTLITNFNNNPDLFEELAMLDTIYTTKDFKESPEDVRKELVLSNYFRKIEIINYKVILSNLHQLNIEMLSKHLKQNNLDLDSFLIYLNNNKEFIRELSLYHESKKEFYEQIKQYVKENTTKTGFISKEEAYNRMSDMTLDD